MKKNTLILSGGGLCGFSMLGALEALFDEYNQKQFKYIAGTSVGALIGLLLCLKTPREICDIMLSKNLFHEENMDFTEYLTMYGFVKHELIKHELTKHILQDTTFDMLYKHTGITLCIIGTNVTLEQCELFDYKHTPHMQVIDAVCISVSIPFIFQKYTYNDHVYVDGSVSLDFPWHVFNVSDEEKLGVRVRSISKDESIDMLGFTQRLINIVINNNISNKSTLDIHVDYPFLAEYSFEEMTMLYNKGKDDAYIWLKKLK